ncbi:hypothetical protein Sjap_000803 [Stephania japonica]|uniref:Uncharacterized protein n=1 Tax=Stephania japonica TaxID=461633 RepID=A0AAP0PQV6_9MAGN
MGRPMSSTSPLGVSRSSGRWANRRVGRIYTWSLFIGGTLTHQVEWKCTTWSDLGDHSQVSGAHLEARVGSYRDKYRVIGVRLRDLGDHSQVSGAHLEARVESYRDKYRVIGVRLR